MRHLTATTSAGAVVVALLASGCGSSTDSGQAGGDLAKAADGTTCVADATTVGTLPPGFPADFPFPDGSVVYHAEDRGAAGVIVSAITRAPLKEVLASLNGPVQRAGFTVTSGETEDHDAEASWAGNGYRGRWAIKESGSCPGEVSVQVLASKA